MQRSWVTWLTWLGCAALVVAAVLTSGLGRGATHGPAPDRPTQSAAPTPDGGAVTGALLRRVDLRVADLPPGFRRVSVRDEVDPTAEDAVRICGVTLAAGSPRPVVRASTFVGGGSARVRTLVAGYPAGSIERVLTRLRSSPSPCARPVLPGREEQPATLVVRVLTGQAPDRFRHETAVLRRGDVLAVVSVDASPLRFGSGPGRGLGLALDRGLARRLMTALP